MQTVQNIPLEGKSSVAVAKGGGCLCATSIYRLSFLRTCSLSASPEPVSPQPQSFVSNMVPLASQLPQVTGHLSQAKPLESWWVLLSESSPGNLAADSFSAFFVSLARLVSNQQLPAWACILCALIGTTRIDLFWVCFYYFFFLFCMCFCFILMVYLFSFVT